MRPATAAWLSLALLLSAGCAAPVLPSAPSSGAPAPSIHVTSASFGDGEPIPRRHTCEHLLDSQPAETPPPLAVAGLPDGTVAVALVVDDPDAGHFTHWLAWDIPATAASVDLPEGRLPAGAVEGPNGFGTQGYRGPCPATGAAAHHYVFVVHALSRPLGLPAGSTRAEVEAALPAASLGNATLTGTFRLA